MARKVHRVRVWMMMIYNHQPSFHLSKDIGCSTELVESVRIHQNGKIRIRRNLAFGGRDPQIFYKPFGRSADAFGTTNGHSCSGDHLLKKRLETVSRTHSIRVRVLMTEEDDVLDVAD